MPKKSAAERFQVPFKGKFRVRDLSTAPPKDAPDKEACKRALPELVKRLDALQRKLYADDRFSLLLVFQAMDAAGKDSTIRAVLSGIDPAGCQVTSFKAPSAGELQHDFLWRTTLALPQRGSIGVFNRSYYEEVITARVHPEFLAAQKLPALPEDLGELWQQRYESIRHHEKHLARSGTVILKFWLNVSPEEQRRRLLARLDEKEKNWKFDVGDLAERKRWRDYMDAYETALRETSRPWAPWHAIPADSKSYMRMAVAQIVVETLEGLDMDYPKPGAIERRKLKEMRKQLAR